MRDVETKRKLFDDFNEFIINQPIDPYETCMFIYSLLQENGYTYRATGCSGDEWWLKDNQ